MGRRIGMTYDLRTDYLSEGFAPEKVAEFDSEETVSALETAIRSLGYETDRIGNARALCGRITSGDRWGLVFNIAEGLKGRCREAQVPSILEVYDIPYTFSDPTVCALTLDKGITKRLVRGFGLPTPKFKIVRQVEETRHLQFDPPFFAKPLSEGTGKGVDARSRADTLPALSAVCGHLLEKFRQPVIVEEFLPGREFTVGVLGTDDDAVVLGVMEIEVMSPQAAGVYSMDAKEDCENQVRYAPLAPGKLCSTLGKLALKVHRLLECRDASRADFRLDHKGDPSFIEINPLPGLHPTHSDLPMIAGHQGMEYPELIRAIIESAMMRCGVS